MTGASTWQRMFNQPSYIYFAANTDAIKIGFSTQPFLRQLQLHPRKREIWMIGVTPGGQPDEADLHRQFKHLRVPLYDEREWFRAAPELVQFIDGLEAREELIPWFSFVQRMQRKNGLKPKWVRRKSWQLLNGYFPQQLDPVTTAKSRKRSPVTSPA